MDNIVVGKHHPVLDGLRGIACLMVIIFHASIFISPDGDNLGSIERIGHGLTLFGQSGVDLFFVLSGFLITGILMETANAPSGIKKFYIRRSLRIFPLYFGVLLLSIVIATIQNNAFPDLNKILIHTFYLQNWGAFDTATFNHLLHTWSLAVEEQFYICWPFLFLLCYKKSPLYAAILCVVMIFIAIIAKTGYLHYGQSKLAYTATLPHMDSLIMGALCIVTLKHYKEVVQKHWRTVFYVAIASLLLSFVILFTAEDKVIFRIWGIMFASIFYSYLVLQLMIKHKKSVFRMILGSRILTHFGRLSYGLYVFHLPVFMLMGRVPIFTITPESYVSDVLKMFLVGGVITYVCAFISYELYEKHFLKLKDKLAPSGDVKPI